MMENGFFYDASDQHNEHNEMDTRAMEDAKTPLSAVVDAFEYLARQLGNLTASGSDDELHLDKFCDACLFVSVLFNYLGLAFKFAEAEYDHKVRDLVEASKFFKSLQNLVDEDVAHGTVRSHGSHTRNLRRVRQGLDLIRALFEQFLSTTDYSLKDAATFAYSEVCAPFHTWAVRTAVYAGMYTLPTRAQLLLRLNETGNSAVDTWSGPACLVPIRLVENDELNNAVDLIAEQSAEKKMNRYIQAVTPVIQYIDRLYVSRDISLDW